MPAQRPSSHIYQIIAPYRTILPRRQPTPQLPQPAASSLPKVVEKKPRKSSGKRRPRGGKRVVHKWESVQKEVSENGVRTLSITDPETGTTHSKFLSEINPSPLNQIGSCAPCSKGHNYCPLSKIKHPAGILTYREPTSTSTIFTTPNGLQLRKKRGPLGVVNDSIASNNTSPNCFLREPGPVSRGILFCADTPPADNGYRPLKARDMVYPEEDAVLSSLSPTLDPGTSVVGLGEEFVAQETEGGNGLAVGTFDDTNSGEFSGNWWLEFLNMEQIE